MHTFAPRKTWLNTGNKSCYKRVEYRRIQRYTIHTRIRKYTDTHSVSVRIKPCIPLYLIYLGKYCAVIKILGITYLSNNFEI